LSYISIPNILTMLRIVLIPVFVSTLIYRKYNYAMYVFSIAAITDFLDGMIARVKKQQTELGKFLDPIADKFLLITSFVLFAIYGFVPKWLSITVISRDIIIVTGWLIIFFITHKAKVEPTFLGKLSNASQLFLVAYILVYINFRDNLWLPEPIPLIVITAFLTIISGMHYIIKNF